MADYEKPLPDLNDRLSGPFWQAAKLHQLKMQQCPSCGYIRWPATKHCPECLEVNDEWVALSGRGKVWSFGVWHHLFNHTFHADMPYNVALIQLDEGPRIYSTVVGIDNDRIRPEMSVEVVFDDVTPEVTLPKFRPA